MSFSLVRGPPRDLQITAYKYDTAHAHYRLTDFCCKYDTAHTSFRPPLQKQTWRFVKGELNPKIDFSTFEHLGKVE